MIERADPGIFLCYRRDDTQGYAGWLWESLSERFGRGRVFRDIDEIEPGLNFVEVIDGAMAKCRACLVLIGPRWLTVADKEGTPRLHLDTDFVRLEVSTALSQDMRVIPVLLQGAEMPTEASLPDVLKPLALRNAVELSESRWHYDVDRLVNVLTVLLESPQTTTTDLGKEIETSEKQETTIYTGDAIGPASSPEPLFVPPNPLSAAAMSATAYGSTKIETTPEVNDPIDIRERVPIVAESLPVPMPKVAETPREVAPAVVPAVAPETSHEIPPSAPRHRGLLVASVVGLMVVGVIGVLLFKGNQSGSRSPGATSLASPAPSIGDTPTSAAPTPTTTPLPQIPKVDPPTHLEVTSISQTTVELRWTRPDGQIPILRYLIIRNGQEIGKTTSLTFTDEGLSAGSTYHYRILAVARGSKTSSKVLEVTTDAPPPPPPPPTPEEICQAQGGVWTGTECIPP